MNDTALLATLDVVTESLAQPTQTRGTLMMAATMLDAATEDSSAGFIRTLLSHDSVCSEELMTLATEGLMDSIGKAYKAFTDKLLLLNGRFVSFSDRISAALNPWNSEQIIDARRDQIEKVRSSNIVKWLKYGVVLTGLIAAGAAAVVAGKSVVAARQVVVKEVSKHLGLAGESAASWPKSSALRVQFGEMGASKEVVSAWDREIAQTILKESKAFTDKIRWMFNEIKDIVKTAWYHKSSAMGPTEGMYVAKKLTGNGSPMKIVRALNRFLFGALGFLIAYTALIVNKIDRESKRAYQAYKKSRAA